MKAGVSWTEKGARKKEGKQSEAAELLQWAGDK